MTKTKPSTKILKAMEIIGSPERWTKNVEARDEDGYCVDADNQYAVCYCSVGALEKVNGTYGAHYVAKAVSLDTSSSETCIVKFNDSKQTKHKDVMNMFMTAAFLALSEGK